MKERDPRFLHEHDWRIVDNGDRPFMAQRQCVRCGMSWSPRYFPRANLPKCMGELVISPEAEERK